MRTGTLKLCLVALIAFSGCNARSNKTDQSASPKSDSQPGKIVLFDGKDTSAWQHLDGSPCKWKLIGDAMEVNDGDIVSKQKFSDFTLHVEFWIPKLPPEVTGQARGNSGVYMLGRYEIQVLDSYGLKPEVGDCGAVYGQKPPDVNACLPPENWQTYDIQFIAPVFDATGNKIKNPRVTVTQNDKLIHNDVEIKGPTRAGEMVEKPGGGPIRLQDHHNAVRYRNIWIIPAEAKG